MDVARAMISRRGVDIGVASLQERQFIIRELSVCGVMCCGV